MCWPSQRHTPAYAVLPSMRTEKWRHLTYLFDHRVPNVFISQGFPSDLPPSINLFSLRMAELSVSKSKGFQQACENLAENLASES